MLLMKFCRGPPSCLVAVQAVLVLRLLLLLA